MTAIGTFWGDYYRLTLGAPQPLARRTFRFGSGAVELATCELAFAEGPSLFFAGTTAVTVDGRPVEPSRMFISMTDDAPEAMAELTAAALDFDTCTAPLGFGDTFPLGARSALRVRGLEACLVLSGAALPRFAESIPLSGRTVALHCVLPLAGTELRTVVERGLGPLFEQFATAGRPVFQLGGTRAG